MSEDLLDRVLRRRRDTAGESLWAIRDLTFDVAAGERVGVIGRNGAGKSTLLKVLARVTTPTEGRIELRGRVGALLEVGTGFHPELTGRENIYLAGAILGMGHREIAAKLDDIVAFAGVSDFLGTPVKRYSSGMYLRLAFAIAAHLEPDVLLVDEVLAVGDVEFQRKCLGQMDGLARGGRTVVFVSHSMPTVLRFCERVIVLERGGVRFDGSPQDAVHAYLEDDTSTAAAWRTDADDVERAPGDDVAKLRSVTVLGGDGRVTDEIDIERAFTVETEYWHVGPENISPLVTLQLFDEQGTHLFNSADIVNHAWRNQPRRKGVVRARCTVPANLLAEGRYFVNVLVTSGSSIEHLAVRDAVSFQVVDPGTGRGARANWGGEWPGVIRPLLAWDIALVD